MLNKILLTTAGVLWVGYTGARAPPSVLIIFVDTFEYLPA